MTSFRNSDSTTSMRFWVALVALLHTFLVSGRSAHKSGSSGTVLLQTGSGRSPEQRTLTEPVYKRQRHARALASKAKHAHAMERSACTDLVNHGTHFTVEIEVGTPGQKFDVVADTGSDAIIVPSCTCVKAGYCNSKARCFQGTNRSSTFSIDDGPRGPPTVRMMFGSGPVQAVVASDTVRVGKLHTKMQDGILLMTDQLLNIKGQFEGILGLGLPSGDAKKALYAPGPEGDAQQSNNAAAPDGMSVQRKSHHPVPESALESPGKDVVVASYQKDNGVNIFPFPNAIAGSVTADAVTALSQPDEIALEPMPTLNLAPTGFLSSKKPIAKLQRSPPSKESKNADAANGTGIVVKGFMEEAGIKRFSMCFNDGANGVLRLGTPKVKIAHGSIGQVHWGLDFRGISVGDKTAPVQFCKPENMTKGQKTPCGAIPDSGTTAFMAPKDQLITLYESLCDRWDRCNKNYTAMEKAGHDAKEAAEKAYGVDPFHIQPASKAMIFQQLMLDCRHWLTKESGLDELPTIHFHVGGANGTKQTLNLNGWSYVIETQEKEFKYIYKNIPGLGKLPISKNFTGHSKKVCSPAFSTMEYSTEQNGPVWILGTPIFYEYQVGYDMATKPPQISFSNKPCGSCGGAKTSLMSKHATTKQKPSMRQIRQVDGPLRMPNMDFSKPL